MAESDGGESTKVNNNKGPVAGECWKTETDILAYIRRVFGGRSGQQHIKALTHERINTLEEAMHEITTGSTPFGRALYKVAEASVYNQR